MSIGVFLLFFFLLHELVVTTSFLESRKSMDPSDIFHASEIITQWRDEPKVEKNGVLGVLINLSNHCKQTIYLTVALLMV